MHNRTSKNYLVMATVYGLLSLILKMLISNLILSSLECDICYLVSLSVLYNGNLINGRSNHSSLMIVFERGCKTIIMDLLFWRGEIGLKVS